MITDNHKHLLKNLQNLWLREKIKIIFDDNGVKRAHLKQLYHDPLRAEIRFPDDSQLDFLNMIGNQGKNIKQLSRHPTMASSCNGIHMLAPFNYKPWT